MINEKKYKVLLLIGNKLWNWNTVVDFKKSKNTLISNVTADEILDVKDLKNLLISQIEKKVRWRESIINMVNYGVSQFIEIGPGKVLSGLVKRIDRNVELIQVNTIDDVKNLKIND